MTTYYLKVVPNDAPNADGTWECHDLDVEPTFDFEPRPGVHVVQIKRKEGRGGDQ